MIMEIFIRAILKSRDDWFINPRIAGVFSYMLFHIYIFSHSFLSGWQCLSDNQSCWRIRVLHNCFWSWCSYGWRWQNTGTNSDSNAIAWNGFFLKLEKFMQKIYLSSTVFQLYQQLQVTSKSFSHTRI
jgi:hypothetical protein